MAESYILATLLAAHTHTQRLVQHLDVYPEAKTANQEETLILIMIFAIIQQPYSRLCARFPVS